MTRFTLVALLSMSLSAQAADPVQVAPAAAAETPAAGAAPAPAAGTTAQGAVVRAQFTTDVQGNEPVDKVTSLSTDQTRILFFTELRDLAGQTVTHRWEHGDKVVSEVPLQVGAARWRTFSSKTLNPSMSGEWKASVLDASGQTLAVATFSYVAPAKAEPAPSAPPKTQ
jgi:hypothetical protein